MNYWMAVILLTAMPATAAAAESLDAATESTASVAPIDPLFDCYRANSAWGLTYSGKVIDRSGRIWSYTQRNKSLPVPLRENDRIYYPATDLAAKYAGATHTASVDSAALAAHVALVAKAAVGKITWADTGVRDAGTSTCHAYVFDATRKRYRDVELGSDGGVGDRRVSNDAADAQTLLQWLRTSGVAQ
jgi:hypothetical protein